MPPPMVTTGFLMFVGLIVVYSLVAARLEHLWVTGPIVFLLLGLLLSPEALAVVDIGVLSEIVRVTAVVTLTLLLFSDASTVDLAALRRDAGTPMRLLLIGLPLTVLLGGVTAWLLLPTMAVGLWALTAAILAPTDLSLGLAMFKNPRVPNRVRRELNVESGLNDGIVAPLITLFIAVAIADTEHTTGPVAEAVREIGLGAAAGIVIGVAGGLLLRRSKRSDWSSVASREFAALGLALLAYVGAVLIHGNGFIAAFVAGLAFGALARATAHAAARFSEETGTLLSLAVWFVFGAAVGPVLLHEGLQWRPIFYALLSLTVIRMVPVALALLGKEVHWSTTLFVGWFGPRGLASVVFLLMALRSLDEAGINADLLLVTAGWTIFLSVILHGVSAGPVAAWYGRKAESFLPGSPELGSVAEVHVRRGIATPSSHREA